MSLLRFLTNARTEVTIHGDSAFAGDVGALPDSAVVTTTGFGAEAATWSATTGGSSWLQLTTATGQGSGTLRWSRDPTGLSPGTYVETITVSLAGAATPAAIRDTLRILAIPITVDAAANALLNATAVSPAQSAYLDSRGNGDGVFNLGDFLALLDRVAASSSMGSIVSDAGNQPASNSIRRDQ